MSDLTVDDVLGVPTSDEIEDLLLAELADPDFLVDDFESGSAMRTLVELENEVISDLVQSTVPLMLSQGFVDTSDLDWLSLVAASLYGLTRTPGTIAEQTVILASLATNPSYTLSVGKVFLKASDGRRYVQSSGNTILAPGGTVAIEARGVAPGKALGLVNAIDTASLRGVSVVSASTPLVGGVLAFGSNDETDESLVLRCMQRWRDFEAIPEQDRVEEWASKDNPEITRVKIDPDPVYPGGVILTVAGVAGAVSAAAVSIAQGTIDAYCPITDLITVRNATNYTITPEGTVTVPAGAKAAIIAAADAAWNAYLASSRIASKVYLGKLIQFLMDAGAIDCVLTSSDFQFNGDCWWMENALVPVPNPLGLGGLIGLYWVLV